MVKRILYFTVLALFIAPAGADIFVNLDGGASGADMAAYNRSSSSYDAFNSMYGTYAESRPAEGMAMFGGDFFVGEKTPFGTPGVYFKVNYIKLKGGKTVYYETGHKMLSISDNFDNVYTGLGLRHYFGKRGYGPSMLLFAGADAGLMNTMIDSVCYAYFYDGADAFWKNLQGNKSYFGASFETGAAFCFNEYTGIFVKTGYRMMNTVFKASDYRDTGEGISDWNVRGEWVIVNSGFSQEINLSGFFISAGISAYFDSEETKGQLLPANQQR
jgi:hypothetical protein